MRVTLQKIGHPRRVPTLDARGQHDGRRGALDAVECADAVDQRIELADRAGRDDGDQVERAADRMQDLLSDREM